MRVADFSVSRLCKNYAKFAERMEHNTVICKRTQCKIIENYRVLTSVYGPLSSEGLGVVFLHIK